MTHWNSSYYRSKYYNRVIKGSVDSIINEFPSLPVEPEICQVFLDSINNHNELSADLIKFIALSPSLTFNILNLVHSPFYNGKIVNFNDALSLIGKDTAVHVIRDFLICSSGAEEFGSVDPRTDTPYYGSLKSAHLSALISEELEISSQFNAYVTALLHNVGAIALSKRFPNQYHRLKISDDFSHSGLVAVEDNALGVNHCFMGARMVEHWNSFPFIADALFYHHHTLNKIKQASKLVKLIYFSSMVDNSCETDHSMIVKAGKELFDFTEVQIDEYISIAELKVQNRLLHLGIEVSDSSTEVVYQPDNRRETINLNRAGDNSLLSALIAECYKSENKKGILSQIGKSIQILTGVKNIFYFKYNEINNSLDGINIDYSTDKDASSDFSIPIDTRSSIIVNSFLMGMVINSNDRVDNSEQAIFDLQISNYMGTDGLYCLPLIKNDRATGIIVLGITPAGIAGGGETAKKLRYFLEAVIPLLSDEETKDSPEGAVGKNAESELMQTRKLIHEINNPLSAVKNYLKVLSMKLDDINVENKEIRIIDDELNRIAKLLKEFKTSSPESDKKIAKTVSSINRIISDTILLIKNSRVNGPAVNIELESDENVPEIMIDKDAFRQVLINLINNSIEAMPAGGNVSVGVRYADGLKQGDIHTDDSEGPGKRIEISIADDGPGFPDHLKKDLFKRQSTTKTDHDGLGLLIVHELVKKMGGSVALDEQITRGTRFRITLPVN